MLEALRSFVGGWGGKILLGLIVIMFGIVFGVADVPGFGGGDPNAVATVGETSVPPSRFVSTYFSSVQQASQRLGRRLTQEQARLLGLEQQAIATVVSGATLDEYARELGVRLSDAELGRMIGQQAQFRDSQGQFDRDRFRDAVRNAQTTEAAFVDDQNRAAVRAQIASASITGELVPNVFRNAAARFQGEKRTVEAVVVTPDQAGRPAAPTDVQLQEYFEANRTRYDAPEYRKLAVLKLEPEDLAEPGAVEADVVRAEYDRRRTSYTTPERRRIQQVRFASREKAEAALKALEDGTLFETVLADNNVSAADADLGVVTRSQLPDPTVAEAAFTLPLNQHSEIIDGRFGPVIVRPTEIQPEVVRSFEDVEEEIRQRLALEAAADRIGEIYARVEDLRAGGAAVEEAAREAGLTVRTVDAIDRQGRDADGNEVTDLPRQQDLLRQAFAASEGPGLAALELGTAGYAWFDVLAIEPTRPRTLEEARDRVVADWTRDEQSRLLDAKAEEIEAQLKTVPQADAVAQGANAELVRVEDIDRNARNPQIGREGVGAAFEGPDGSVATVTAGSDRRVVLRVTSVSPPAVLKLNDAQKARLEQSIAADIMQQVLTKLQNQYGATVNRQTVQAALSRY